MEKILTKSINEVINSYFKLLIYRVRKTLKFNYMQSPENNIAYKKQSALEDKLANIAYLVKDNF